MIRLFLKISVISLVLLSNTTSFGMKRLRETDETDENQIVRGQQRSFPSVISAERRILKPKANVTVESLQQSLENFFLAGLPNLKIVDTLAKLSHENNVQLSVQQKLNKLSAFSQPREKRINGIQDNRRLLLLALPADEAKMRLKREFLLMVDYLFEIKIKAQEELREAFNIDPHAPRWIGYILEAKARAVFDLKTQKRPCNNTTWDHNVPQNFATTLIKKMIEKGLEPTAFGVHALTKENLSLGAAGCLGAQSTVVSVDKITSLTDSSKKQRWHYQNIRPGYIFFNPSLINKNEKYIDFVVEHELTHALECDFQVADFLVNAVARCANVAPEQVMAHPAYLKLRLAFEINADTRLFIEDWTKVVDATFIAKNFFYPESYSVFAMIKTNREVLAEITAQEERNNAYILPPKKKFLLT